MIAAIYIRNYCVLNQKIKENNNINININDPENTPLLENHSDKNESIGSNQLNEMIDTNNYKINLFGKNTSDAKMLVIRGLFYICTQILFCASFQFITGGEAVTLRALSSIWISIVSVFILKEKFRIGLIVGVILSLIGIILVCQPMFIFGETSSNTAKPYAYIGYILVLFAGFAQTCQVFILRKDSHKLHWIQVEFATGTHEFFSIANLRVFFPCLLVYFFFWNFDGRIFFLPAKISYKRHGTQIMT